MVTLTITPVSNIDYENRQVINNAKVTTKEYDWHDKIRVFDVKFNREENNHAGGISLYDHRLIIDEERYHVLHFFSKG